MNRFLQRVKDLWIRFFGFPAKEVQCEHEWRPCVAHNVTYNEEKPSRQCLWCGRWEPLSNAQFYALFGEHFYVMLQHQHPAMQRHREINVVEKDGRREKPS